MGSVALQAAPYTPGEIELAYHFARSGLRRGLATEAARLLLEHGLRRMGLACVVAAIVPTNERSVRLAERLGMRKVAMVEHAGTPHSLYRIDRNDPIPRC